LEQEVKVAPNPTRAIATVIMFFFIASKFAKIAPVPAIVCRINQDRRTIYGKMQPRLVACNRQCLNKKNPAAGGAFAFYETKVYS
jgi:hypothetical protein